MVKSVLCFGDSLTWGSNAETGGRHSHDDLWPSVLQKALGSDVHVIHEGLGGRTTAYDDHTGDCDRNGARLCRRCCIATRRWIWLSSCSAPTT